MRLAFANRSRFTARSFSVSSSSHDGTACAAGATRLLGATRSRAALSSLSLDANTTTSMLSGNDATNYMMEFVGDIFTAKDWIFGFGFAVALLVGFLFTSTMNEHHLPHQSALGDDVVG